MHHLMHTYHHEEIYRQLRSEAASAVGGDTCGRASLTGREPEQAGLMQFSLRVEITPASSVHSTFEAEQTKPPISGRSHLLGPHHRHRPNLLLLIAASNQQT